MLSRRALLQSITAALPAGVTPLSIGERTRAVIFDLPDTYSLDEVLSAQQSIESTIKDRLPGIEVFVTCGGIRTTVVEG